MKINHDNWWEDPGIGKTAILRGTWYQRVWRWIKGEPNFNIKLIERKPEDLLGLPREYRDPADDFVDNPDNWKQ